MSDLFGGVLSVLRNPADNLTAAVLLLAAVVLFLLICMILLLVWVLSLNTEDGDAVSRKRTPSAEELESAEESRRRVREVVAAVLVGGVLLVLGIGYTRAASDDACLSCHLKDAPVASAWSEGAHASTDCWSCHGGSGVLGGVAARLPYGRWLLLGRSAEDPVRPAEVSSHSCVRCHAEALRGTLQVGDIRMRHADPIAAGYECADCHGDAGHEVKTTETTSRMAECLRCHDGKIAAAQCDTCHVTDVSRATGTPPDRFPKVEMGKPETCRGCHEVESCNECHGIELPHTRAFMTTGAHAREAGFTRRPTCEKCHETKLFCNRCHQFGSGHEGSSWLRAHGPEAKAAGGDARCRACHRRSENFCALCHADSRRGGQ